MNIGAGLFTMELVFILSSVCLVADHTGITYLENDLDACLTHFILLLDNFKMV